MKNEEIEKNTAVCNRTSEILEALDQKVLEWADTEVGLYDIFFEEMEEYREAVQDMPEEWRMGISNQFTAGKVFANPPTLKKCLNENRDVLNREEKQLIRRFLGNPWFYSVFSVEEEIGKNFLRIYDYAEKEEFLLYSKGVQQFHRYSTRLYLCLMLDNGECLQTYGTINHYKGLSARDIETFARFTGHHFERSGDLSTAINHNPLPFLLLMLFAEIPPVMIREGLKEFCYHSAKVDDFSPPDLAKTFNTVEKEGIIRFTRKESPEPDYYQGLYYEKENRMLHAYGLTLDYYTSIVEHLKNRYDFPEEPAWRISPPMIVALEKILGVQLPVYKFERLFTPKPDPETAATVEKLNALIKEITDNHNKGIAYSVDELAEKYDVPGSEISKILNHFKQRAEKFVIDIKGGFKDFTPPSPEIRMKFREPFPESSLFEFNSSAKAGSYLQEKIPGLADDLETLGYDEELHIAELPEFIEDLFFAYWEVHDCTILLYTLYLLSKKGENFLPIRDYAVEFLRIFWHTILPDKSKREIQKFIKDYRFFGFNVLYSAGLIEIESKIDVKSALKTDYNIKATPFFYEWLTFDRSL